MQEAQIRRFAPGARASLVKAVVTAWPLAEEAGITTPLRTQHFMANVAVETGGLSSVSESLNYSPEGLRKTFSRKRISDADCKRLGRTKNRAADQEAIANLVYGGEWGRANLGNTEPGDGWRYRGAGALQTTGRANFRKMGFEDNPDGLRDPVTAIESAVREWKNRNCNATADRDDAEATRKKINPALAGMAECRRYLARAKNIWTADAAHAPSDAPAPPAPKPPKLTQAEIEFWQQRLILHGVHSVGVPDGKLGPNTGGAITAFQINHGLPVSAIFDDATRAELAKAPTIPAVSEERAQTTADDIRADGSRTVAAADNVGTAGKLGVAGGVGLGGLQAASSWFSDVRSYIQPVMDTFSAVPMYVWAIVIAGIFGYTIFQSRRVVRYRVQDVRSGKFIGQAGASTHADPAGG